VKIEGRISRRQAIKVILAGAVGLGLAACGGGGQKDFSSRFAAYQPANEPNGDLSKVVWPDFVLAAGPEVRKLYEFQVQHGEIMRYMPCFCGCGQSDGHRNNRDCYIQAVNPDGTVVFDSMAPT